MEIYGKKDGTLIAVERLQNGRISVKPYTSNTATSFNDYSGLCSYLYNNGFHLLATDRSVRLGAVFFAIDKGPEFLEMVTRNELAFQRNGKMYTCWFLAYKPGQIEAKCNCDFAYTNALGYKAVTLNFEDIIVLKGDI